MGKEKPQQGCTRMAITNRDKTQHYLGTRTNNLQHSICVVWHQMISHLTPELNPSAQRYLTRFLQGTFLLEPCISLTYA
jgi:hypothetical protein